MIILAPRQSEKPLIVHEEPWCSGLTCLPVTQKIAGSNPVGSGRTSVLSPAEPWSRQTPRSRSASVRQEETLDGVLLRQRSCFPGHNITRLAPRLSSPSRSVLRRLPHPTERPY